MSNDDLIWKIRKHSTIVKDVMRIDREGNLFADLTALLEHVGFHVIRDFVWIVVKNDGSAHEVYVDGDRAKERWRRRLVDYMRHKKIEFDIDSPHEGYEAIAQQYEFPWSYRKEPIR